MGIMSEAKDDDTVVLDTQDLIDRDENPWSVETFPPGKFSHPSPNLP